MATAAVARPDIAAPAVQVDAPHDHRPGANIAPWAAMAGLLLAAGAARVAVTAFGDDAEVAHTVAGAAFVVAVVAAFATRRRLTSRRMRNRFLAALYLGASWLATITHTGITWGAVAALTILGSGLSLLWWKEHRAGYPPIAGTDVTEMPLLLEPGDDDLYVERWARNLGAASRSLAGSYLAKPEIIKAGYRYELRLVPGVHTVSQTATMVATLRSGLGLMPGQDVIVEEHPTEPAPTAILTIVTRSPIREPRVWPGPDGGFDPTLGSVNLGPFVDDEGPPAKWSTYKKDGIFGGYLQGAPGSGKSRMIEAVACSLAASATHPTVIWYGDGQNGDSSPMLIKHADFVATTFESIYNMLDTAVRVMKINGVENRLSGKVGFHPTTERPGLVVIVDESHKPLSPQENPLLAGPMQRLMATIAREGRKVGVALILASQSPTLDAFGGAGNLADTLRSSLLAGNGMILRSKTPNTKTVFGVDIDPRQFPKLPGYAYLCDPEEGARSAPFRGYWITDELAAYWPQRIVWRSLPARQGNFAGTAYAKRREVAAEQTHMDQLLLELADAGNVDDNEAFQRAFFPAQVAAQAAASDLGDNPAVEDPEKFWLKPQTAKNPKSDLLPGQKLVLDSIVAGHTSPKTLIAATGYSESQIHNLLGELVALGRIVKARYGHYQAADAPARVLPLRMVQRQPEPARVDLDANPDRELTDEEFESLIA